jgi:hypothetical protein
MYKALLLLTLLFPQTSVKQPEVAIRCIQTGETQKEFLLSCNDPQKTELLIPVSDWPAVWHGPERGFAYPLDANGAALPSLPAEADKEAYRLRIQKIRENQLKEMRRWRIQPTQQRRTVTNDF